MTALEKACLGVPLLVVALTLSYRRPSQAGTEAAAAHMSVQCTECHSLVADRDATVIPSNNYSLRCRSCHQSFTRGSESVPLSFHKDPTRNCADCHSFHDTQRLVAAGRSFLFDFKSATLRLQCYSCHAPEGNLSQLSLGHRQAYEIYHSDYRYLISLSPSQSCLLCHSQGSGSSYGSVDAPQISRINEHASHPTGIPVIPGVGNNTNHIRYDIDPRIILSNRRIECQTCHLLSGRNEHLMVVFKDPYDICLGCHQHNP